MGASAVLQELEASSSRSHQQQALQSQQNGDVYLRRQASIAATGSAGTTEYLTTKNLHHDDSFPPKGGRGRAG